ncbi:MAG: DUF362 domain-containing protein [Polyangiaceae bacterium]|nr:DUF362 domain-containing protein [Polyangiaceae bacterium]
MSRLSQSRYTIALLLGLLVLFGCKNEFGQKASPGSTPKPSPAILKAPPLSGSDDPLKAGAIPQHESSEALKSRESTPELQKESMEPVDGVSSASEMAYAVQRRERTAAAMPTQPLSDRNEPVYVVRGLDPQRAAYELIKSMALQLNPEQPVLLLPNVGGITWYSRKADDHLKGRITDPRFVAGIIEYLIEKKFKKITLGISWAIGKPEAVKEMLRLSGYTRLANTYPEVTLIDLFDYGPTKKSAPGAQTVHVPLPAATALPGELYLPQAYLWHQKNGLVINLPKLKMHRFAVLTAGIKNFMGLLEIDPQKSPGKTTKWKMHRELGAILKAAKSEGWTKENLKRYTESRQIFDERLADIYEATRPHLTLVDGILASDGDGFNSLSSVPLALALGSKNTAYVDQVAATIAGYWPPDPKSEEWQEPLGLRSVLERYYGGKTTQPELKGAKRGDLNGRLRLEALNGKVQPGTYREKLSGTKVNIEPQASPPSFDELTTTFPLQNTKYLTRDYAGQRLPPGMTTAVNITQSDQNLIFTFRSDVLSYDLRTRDEPDPLEGHDVPQLFRWDTIEIFLDPTPASPKEYYEFEVSPEGEKLDLHTLDGPGRFDQQWESQALIESEVVGNVWYLQLTFPIRNLHAATEELKEKGSSWKMNIFRTERYGKERIYSAWQPTLTKRPNLHVPERFGSLILDPHRPDQAESADH